MTWITKIALKKRWITVLVSALVAGASIWAMLTLNMELIPDIELPMTTVITVYPDAQPDEVVEQVTIPIEETAEGISGFKHVSSTSSESSSVVFFQFEFGTNMEKTNDIIATNLAQLDLPEEVRNLPDIMTGLEENPTLWPINMDLMPVVTLSLSGDIPDEELKQVTLTQIVPQLEELDGVLSVSYEGGSGDKVLVNPNLDKMVDYNISVAQLAGVLGMPQYNSLAEIENAVLSQEGIRLNQVADVSVGPATGTAISRTNGQPSISINVTKESTANTVTTANAVTEKAEEIADSLPAGMELNVILDQSEYIEASVADLTNNVLLGSGLAVLVVFIFLMAFRASLVTAVSIPLSLLIGFLVMRFTGITINILTLSAMIIAVGRVIDNSIVILEVLYRRMQHGEQFYEAAINGVREVVAPITSATIATVVIFIPLAFVGGIVGEVFIPFGLTIAYALIGSLLISLTVVPALSGYLVHIKTQQEEPRPYWYQKGYTASLRWCLNHRIVTLSIATILFLGSFMLVPIIGTSFMPEMNTDTLTVNIEMPKGTDLSTLNDVTVAVENVLATTSGIESYSTVAGAATGVTGEIYALFGMGGSSNTATIEVITTSGADTDQLIEQLETTLAGITNTGTIRVSAMAAMGGAMASGFEITIRGDNYDDVILAANQLFAAIEAAQAGEESGSSDGMLAERNRKALSEIEDLSLELANIEPTLIIDPDYATLASLGFSEEQLLVLQQEFLWIKYGGPVISQDGSVVQANIDGITRDIFLEGAVKDQADIETSHELLVGWPTPVPLGNIATVELGVQAAKISRVDGKVSATITGTITEEDVGAISQAVQSEIDSLDLPQGVEISQGGIMEEMTDSFSAMFIAIPIAMALAYLVMVLTFRSFRNPIIIMISMPLASIGALLGLFVTGHPLGITGLMGILMLVGIVLTNAVVLIAVVEQMRKDGMSPYQALIEGARTRLRPILMTAITTMIAMVPLALGLGEGVMMATELAIVVIGGLLSSTLLTLLVIPVVYAMANRVPRTISVKK